MGSKEDSNSAREVASLIRQLEKARKKLHYHHVPVRITAYNVVMAQTGVLRLRTFGKGPTAKIVTAVSETQKAIDEVLERLDIEKPQYAPPEEMCQYTRSVRVALMAQTSTLLRGGNMSFPGHKRFIAAINKALDGEKQGELLDFELLFIEGLLTGMSAEAMRSKCLEEDKDLLEILFLKSKFEELHELFQPDAVLQLGRPVEFGQRINGQAEMATVAQSQDVSDGDDGDIDVDDMEITYISSGKLETVESAWD